VRARARRSCSPGEHGDEHGAHAVGVVDAGERAGEEFELDRRGDRLPVRPDTREDDLLPQERGGDPGVDWDVQSGGVREVAADEGEHALATWEGSTSRLSRVRWA